MGMAEVFAAFLGVVNLLTKSPIIFLKLRTLQGGGCREGTRVVGLHRRQKNLVTLRRAVE